MRATMTRLEIMSDRTTQTRKVVAFRPEVFAPERYEAFVRRGCVLVCVCVCVWCVYQICTFGLQALDLGRSQ